jgi:DNA-binding XRE family transcriptional regulator
MNDESIMECVNLITCEMPTLRDKIGMTQRELAQYIGISRQSIIEIEHRNRKITKSILISLITFFSFRQETSIILYDKGLYDNEFVNIIGFSNEFLKKIYGIEV